jgi:poly(hydroxyalkanoate) granule-associated protein
MAAKKRTTRRRSTRRPRPTTRARKTARPGRARTKRTPARKPRATGRRTAGRGRKRGTGLEHTWTQVQASLAEVEARLEKEVRTLADRLGIDTRQAAKHVKEWNRRLDREVQKASRQIDTGLGDLRKTVKKEQRALSGMVDDAVERALATLNIPTRREVQTLTRKVHQLSRKIDRYGR